MSKTNRKPEDPRMSLGEHLEELRKRLFFMAIGLAVAMGATLLYAPEMLNFLKSPYTNVINQLNAQRPPGAELIRADLTVLEVSAGLTNYLKVSFYAGLVIASPWLFYQLWAFISAGLYEREKRYVRLAAPLCAVLFIAGAAFFLTVVCEGVLYYLLGLSMWLGLMPTITFENHINFMTQMMLVFGIAFQTPVLILGLTATGLVTISMLHQYRKHVVVVIVILAAVLTPPDPFSQIALAVPMWLLYEFGILLSYLMKRKNLRAAKDD